MAGASINGMILLHAMPGLSCAFAVLHAAYMKILPIFSGWVKGECSCPGVQQELDEGMGCCLAYVEELALRQHLVQNVSQLQRMVSPQHAFA